MKSPKEQEDTLKKLNIVDLEELKLLVKELEGLRTKDISIHNLIMIGNASRSLLAFKEKYMLRVINLLKKGYLLD